MHQPPRVVEAEAGERWLAAAMLVLAVFILGWAAIEHVAGAVRAVRFPYELDYGEGIVWQQMRLIMAGKGYGPIDRFPAIVFHYPPLYHAATAMLAAATGMDELAAGRALSVSATVATAGFVGLITQHVAQAGAGGTESRICGVVAGLVVLSMTPVVQWSALMRVDMLALALTFAGVYLGMRALTRPMFVVAAAVCFVAAVYTRQSAVAAPAAVFATLSFVRPRTALAGIATSIVGGVAVLVALQLWTDGGFARHVFLYNLNRLDLGRLGGVAATFGVKAFYLGVAGVGIAHRLRSRAVFRDVAGLGELRRRMTVSPADAAFLMLLAYALLSTLTLVMVAKSGSNINYLLEWVCILASLVGLALRNAAAAAIAPASGQRFAGASPVTTYLLPLAVAAQALLLPWARDNDSAMLPARQGELDRLAELVRTARRPVISDDMVVLLRGGRQVVWEAAIFAELASTGYWKEEPFVRRIEAGTFAFFITAGKPGERPYGSRYNPAVVRAIDFAYPVKTRLAGHNLHFPAARPGEIAVSPNE